MRSKKIQVIIVSVALVLVLIGMIVATALISKKNDDRWEYISSNEKLNYDNSPNDTEFQHAENFRHSIEAYFTSLLKGFLPSMTGVNKYIENAMSTFSNKLVNAMGEARISSVKLNKISQAIENNSVEAIFNRIKTEISKVKSLEELEKDIAAKVENMSFLSFVGGIISGFMNETALTENEIADIIYFYLKQNSDEKYLAYLNLVGKDFFVSFISDTIYALNTLKNVSASEYQLKATANTVRTILYQLGSVYTGVQTVTGGSETMEKILGWTWTYDEKYKNSDKLNAYAEACKGKVGDLFAIIGYVMRGWEVQDVAAVLEYASATDEKDKSDKKIIAAAKIAKSLERALPSIEKGCATSFGSVEIMAKTYSDVSKNLGELAFAVFAEYDKDKTEDDKPEDYSARFDNFVSGYKYMRDFVGTEEELKEIDGNSEEYKALRAKADEFFEIEQGIVSIFGNIISVKIANLSYAFIGEEIK